MSCRPQRLVREQRLEERGRPGQHRDPFALDARQRRACIEHGERRDTRTGDQAGEPARLVAKGMKKRVDDQVPVTSPQAHELAPRGEGTDVLLVRGHHAFRPAGRAGGEHDVGEILAAERRAQPERLVGRNPATAIQEIAPTQRPPGAAGLGHARGVEEHGERQIGEVLRVQQFRVAGAQELVHREEYPRAAAPQDIACLPALEPGVERDDRGARGLRPDRRDDPGRLIWRPDPHAITGANAGRKKGRRRLEARRLQAGKAQGKRAVLDGGRLPMTARRAGQDSGDGELVGVLRGHQSTGPMNPRNVVQTAVDLSMFVGKVANLYADCDRPRCPTHSILRVGRCSSPVAPRASAGRSPSGFSPTARTSSFARATRRPRRRRRELGRPGSSPAMCATPAASRG